MAVGAKGLSLLSKLVTIPLCIQMLGTDRYGVWIAATSVLNWMAMTDFGISAGLVQIISSQQTLADSRVAKQHISASYLFFFLLSAVVLLATVSVASFKGHSQQLTQHSQVVTNAELSTMIVIAGVFLALDIPTGVVFQVVTALQEAYICSFTFIVATLLSLATLTAFRNQKISLVSFTGIWYLPQIVISIGTFVYVFFWRHPLLRPSFSAITRSSMRQLSHISGKMLLIQIAEISAIYISNLVIAIRCGPAVVTAFAVMYSLAMAGQALAYNFVSPLWPAFRAAATRGEYTWIKSEASRYFKIVMLAIAGWAILLSIGGPRFVELWTHGRVKIGTSEALAISSLVVITAATANLRLLANSLNMLRSRGISAFLALGTLASLGWLVSPRLGGSGMALAGVAAGCVEILVISLSLSSLRKELRRERTRLRLGAEYVVLD